MKYSMDGLLGIICMFLNGFVTLCPYNIANTCCNHAINRFHLSPHAASLFVYKFHYPMDLSNLISAFLAFALTVFIDVSFDSKSIHNMSFKRKVSCISMWVTLISSVISYIAFISCEDYRRFRYVYLSIVLMTLSNGFSSCFAFAVNTNSIIYAAGISVSSFTTFILHKVYHWLFNKYNWAEYDYYLVIVQYCLSMYSLVITSVLWMWNQSDKSEENSDVAKYSRLSSDYKPVEIDISVKPSHPYNYNVGYYTSRGLQVKVERKNGDGKIVPEDYVRMDHTLVDDITKFKLDVIKYNDIELGELTTRKTDVDAIYVYFYKNEDNDDQIPLIICVKEDNDKRKYYNRGPTWYESKSLTSLNPDNLVNDGIKRLQRKLDDLRVACRIDLKHGVGKYSSGHNREIIVTRLHDASSGDKIPTGYVRFGHISSDGNNFILGSIAYYGISFNGIKEYDKEVQSVYVYYHKYGDIKYQFPLIVCVHAESSWRYYKRGNEWKGGDTDLNKIDPENPLDKIGDLKKQLGTIEKEYEIRIEQTSKYKARPDNKNDTIDVTEVAENGVFKCYKHQAGVDDINYITLHNEPIKGISELDEGKSISDRQYVFVYYVEDHDTVVKGVKRPILICLSEFDQPNAMSKWYKRTFTIEIGTKWQDVSEEVGYSTIFPSKIEGKLEEKLYEIKNELYESGDKNFPKFSPVLKLDYSPKSTGSSTIKYKTSDTEITVISEDLSNSIFRGYKHYGNFSTIEKITYNGNEINGIENLKDGKTISGVTTFWLFYEGGDKSRSKPLMLYFSNGANNWYGKGKKWEEHTELKKISLSNGLDELDDYSNQHAAIASKLNAISVQGTFKELIYFDNLLHWSPILMLSFSLGTIYAACPIITPYSLIDPDRGDTIDLCILLASTIPSIILAVLDLEKVDYGPSNKWNKNSLFYHYVWFGGLIYIICIYVFTSTIRTPDGWIGKRVKDNTYLVSFFGIMLNITQKLMESSALGGGPVQSHDGFIGSISQFNILLMLSLHMLITLYCDGYFKTLTHVDTYTQPYTYRIQSPWSPFLITSTLKINQIPLLDPPQNI